MEAEEERQEESREEEEGIMDNWQNELRRREIINDFNSVQIPAPHLNID